MASQVCEAPHVRASCEHAGLRAEGSPRGPGSTRVRSGRRGTPWGRGHSPGASARQRPKTPLTAVVPVRTGEGVFPEQGKE